MSPAFEAYKNSIAVDAWNRYSRLIGNDTDSLTMMLYLMTVRIETVRNDPTSTFLDNIGKGIQSEIWDELQRDIESGAMPSSGYEELTNGARIDESGF